MEYKRYHIAIIPPQAIAEQAIATSEALQKFDSFFVLDGQALYPHISLYHAPFAEESLPGVTQALHEVASATEPFTLHQETCYPDQGVWVGVRYVADKAILDLHTRVVEATKEYRSEQNDARYLERWAEMSHKQRTNIQDCGWPNAFTLFSPHLSFAKLRRPSADILSHLPRRDFSFQVERIVLAERGKYGACMRFVADFTLEK
jgi:2'-5' RNA ligase